MFSGIIEATGRVARVQGRAGGRTLWVDEPAGWSDLEPGASVAVNGACLTVVRREQGRLVFDAVGATLQRTLLGTIEPGARVNLERSLKLGGAIDGHLVTGHVDGFGVVRGRRPSSGAVLFTVEAPAELRDQIVPRGSVAVDGVSLTVAEVCGAAFTVSVVPFTLDHTVMGEYRPGRQVHLETDVLAKYVQGALRGANIAASPAGRSAETSL